MNSLTVLRVILYAGPMAFFMLVYQKEFAIFMGYSIWGMGKNKTIPNYKSAEEFLDQIEQPQKRNDAFKLRMMRSNTGEKPVMWI